MSTRVGWALGSLAPAAAEESRTPEGTSRGGAARKAGVQLRKQSLEQGQVLLGQEVFGAAVGQTPQAISWSCCCKFSYRGNTQNTEFAMDAYAAYSRVLSVVQVCGPKFIVRVQVTTTLNLIINIQR